MNGTRRGLFVAWEGGDGAGKTTQNRLFCERLETLGHEVVRTREPGGTLFGELVRGLLLDPSNGGVSAHAEALLFAAARAQHVDELIRPALARGATVVCDRFLGSSLAYQGLGRGLGNETVLAVNEFAHRGTLPDVTVVLDVDPAEGSRRVRGRAAHGGGTAAPDRMESESAEFHRRVRAAYLRLPEVMPAVVVDAHGTPSDVAARVTAATEPFLTRQTGQRGHRLPAGGGHGAPCGGATCA